MSDPSTPFRRAADAPTAVAIARLRSRDVDPIRRVGAALASYRVSTSASPHDRDVDSASKLAFESIGNAAEGLFPIYRKRVYVDQARTTQAQLSVRGYFFVTYFESGKCIITWDHTPRTPNSEMLQSRGTTGSFTDDYDAHLEAVRKAAATDAPIAVRDLQDAIALGDFYYRGVIPVGLALTTVLAVLLPVVPFVFILVWLIRRLLG